MTRMNPTQTPRTYHRLPCKFSGKSFTEVAPQIGECTCPLGPAPFNSGVHQNTAPDPLSILRRTCPEGDTDDNDWCTHLQQYIDSGADAVELDFGMVVGIPFSPSNAIWAEVHISNDSDRFGGLAAPMWMELDDGFTSTPRKVEIGLWSQGEGTKSIRTVLIDWVFGQAKVTSFKDIPQCPSDAHKFADTAKMQTLANQVANIWTVATMRCCVFCWINIAGNTGALVPDTGNSGNSTMNQVRNKVGR